MDLQRRCDGSFVYDSDGGGGPGPDYGYWAL